MENNEIVIIGGGQLGGALQKFFPQARLLDYPEVDITDYESLAAAFAKIENVEAIINTAAWTDVNAAELEENYSKVLKVNCDGAVNLRRIASLYDAVLVQISTDYVFDGRRAFHDEEEEPNPLNIYGSTKRMADNVVADYEKHYIVRISWLVGDYAENTRPNFAKTVVNLLTEQPEVTMIDDQFGRLTFTSDLVEAINFLLETQSEYGIYNVSGDGEVLSWYELAQEIRGAMLNSGKFKDSELGIIVPISSDEFEARVKHVIAQRPRNSALNLAKIQSVGFNPDDHLADLSKNVSLLLEQKG